MWINKNRNTVKNEQEVEMGRGRCEDTVRKRERMNGIKRKNKGQKKNKNVRKREA